MIHLLVAFLTMSFSSAKADPSPAETHRHAKSKCIVSTAAGEYPKTTVSIGKSKILGPVAWGLHFDSFSPSGKYAALTNLEAEMFQVGDKSYGLAIINCESGKVRYYVSRQDASSSHPKVAFYTWMKIRKWSPDESWIEFDNHLSPDHSQISKLHFTPKNPLP